MTDDIREKVRARLVAHRGPELIDLIAEEIGELHERYDDVSRQLKQLKMFQAFAERINLLQEKQSGRRLPTSARIEASHSLSSEDGFYHLEYEQNGRPYRWTGPSPEFAFRLYVDRTVPLKLELEIGYMIDASLQSDIVAMVDGTEVPLEWVLRKADGGSSGKAVIPPSSENRATHVAFVVPHVLQPSSGSDPRRLGVAFRELRIAPSRDVQSSTASVSALSVEAKARPVSAASTSKQIVPVHEDEAEDDVLVSFPANSGKAEVPWDEADESGGLPAASALLAGATEIW